jgi:hypothetical protein
MGGRAPTQCDHCKRQCHVRARCWILILISDHHIKGERTRKEVKTLESERGHCRKVEKEKIQLTKSKILDRSKEHSSNISSLSVVKVQTLIFYSQIGLLQLNPKSPMQFQKIKIARRTKNSTKFNLWDLDLKSISTGCQNEYHTNSSLHCDE